MTNLKSINSSEKSASLVAHLRILENYFLRVAIFVMIISCCSETAFAQFTGSDNGNVTPTITLSMNWSYGSNFTETMLMTVGNINAQCHDSEAIVQAYCRRLLRLKGGPVKFNILVRLTQKLAQFRPEFITS